VGTLLGVLVIPGLYFIFGTISDGRYLLKDETSDPLTEAMGRHDTPVSLMAHPPLSIGSTENGPLSIVSAETETSRRAV
jgi:hypothetical protein